MLLENCCYNKDELLVTSLARNGKLGEICYCHGAYCHDLRNEITEVGLKRGHYRLEEYKNHNCENYPTHELGPIVKLLGITRGNKFTRLTAMASKSRGLDEYINSHDEVSALKGVKFRQGDVVTTAIEYRILLTVRTITTNICPTTGRPSPKSNSKPGTAEWTS